MQATATMLVENPLRERLPQMHERGGEIVHIPDRIRVERSLRDDPLGQMHSRRQIGEAQYHAGRKFQETWEAAGKSLRSSGDIREHVDGGQIASDGITDRRMKAAKLLALWRAELGPDVYATLVALLIVKMNTRQIADGSKHMMPGKASTTFHGHLVRRYLSLLAKHTGHA